MLTVKQAHFDTPQSLILSHLLPPFPSRCSEACRYISISPWDGPFLYVRPRFHASAYQPGSPSRMLPLHRLFNTCYDLCSVSCLLSPDPFLLMPTGNGSNFVSSEISPFLRCRGRLTPNAHHTMPISVVAISVSSLARIGHVRSHKSRSIRSPFCASGPSFSLEPSCHIPCNAKTVDPNT